MINKDQIIGIVFNAVDEVNLLLPQEQRIKKSIDTVFSGSDADLDSLGLINLIVAIEQKVEEELGVSITLADEQAMSQKNNPLRTVETLVDYIFLLLEESTNG